LTEVREAFEEFPAQAALKEVVARLTHDPQWRNILPPNLPLGAAQRAALAAKLEILPQMRTVLAAARAA
jgi:hypothetical protein